MYKTLSRELEKLSDSERALFEERRAIIKSTELDREQAGLEAIKQIIRERIIPGKCDECEKVDNCMLTKKQRALCEVVKIDKDKDKNKSS